MLKNKRVNTRFVEIYETKIKKYRQEYYKNIVNLSQTGDSKLLFIALNTIPVLLGIIIIFLGGFSITSHIFAFISIIIVNIIIKILFKSTNLLNSNNYLNEIMKYGYYSIDDYEAKLKKYVTGPNGYYQYLLQSIMTEYNIADNTRKIAGTHGELYYIWTSSNQDRLYLLNSHCNDKPEIIKIRIVNIRYFRVDNVNKEIVLKTDLDQYTFKLDGIDTLNELIKEKRFENLKNHQPADYINDFELYMHKIKSDVIEKESKSKEECFSFVWQVIVYIIATIIVIFTKIYIKEHLLLLNLVNIVVFAMLCYNIKRLILSSSNYIFTDDDYIRYLNTNEECRERFKELKFALGIKDNYDRVYSNEGACYLTWVANGYFHVFLNLIYFNVVYMVIKTSDVQYYLRQHNECIIKLKDKTLTFTADAEQVFSKILPNKDYKWLKGFKNK